MNRDFNLFDNYPYSPQASGYGSYTGQSTRYTAQPQFQTSYAPPQFQTNKILVTGPEEALMRANQQNCLFVCFNQNKPEMYEVRVDTEGRKKIDTYYLHTTPSNDTNDYDTRLKRLESILLKQTGGTEEDVSTK